MTSSDAYVVLDGKVYRLEGHTLTTARYDSHAEILHRLDSIEAQVMRLRHGQASPQMPVLIVLGVIWIAAGLGLSAFLLSVMRGFKDRVFKRKTDEAELEAKVRRVVKKIMTERGGV